MDTRVKTHTQIAPVLASFDDQSLLKLIETAESSRSSIGGMSTSIAVDDVPIFVKRIPLTDFELQEENIHSTANVFNLPLPYHYGIGSHGFGAWRELAAHITASDWVLMRHSPNFPLLYHWRIIESASASAAVARELGDLDQHMQSWSGSAEIRQRIDRLLRASSEIVLFLEYMPKTLSEWLAYQLADENTNLSQVLEFVETNLNQVNDFMYERGFVHFDAHFDNILTDGKSLLVSDFGLALSESFNLADNERDFLNMHLKSYDRATSASCLTHAVVISLFGKDNWRQSLRRCLDDSSSDIPALSAQVVETYGQLTLATDEFLERLKSVPLDTEYPAAELERLLFEIECANIGRFLGQL